MTPPDTNLRTQRRRHRPALYAIAFVVFFGLLTLLLRLFAATDPDSETLGANPTLREPGSGTQESAPPSPPPQQAGD